MYSDDNMDEVVRQNGKRPIKTIIESDSEDQQSANDNNFSVDVNLNANEPISRTDATETPMSGQQQQQKAPQQRGKRKKITSDEEQFGMKF